MCVLNCHALPPHDFAALFQGPEGLGQPAPTAGPLKTEPRRPQTLAQASGGGAVGRPLGLEVQQQRPKAEPRPLGTGRLRLVGGERLGGLWPRAPRRGLEIRPSSLGSTASGENHRSHVWPSGFHLRWEQSFPHHSPLVPVAGPWGRAGGRAEILGGPLAVPPYPWGGEEGSCHLPPSWGCTGGHGEVAFFGLSEGALSLPQWPS